MSDFERKEKKFKMRIQIAIKNGISRLCLLYNHQIWFKVNTNVKSTSDNVHNMKQRLRQILTQNWRQYTTRIWHYTPHLWHYSAYMAYFDMMKFHWQKEIEGRKLIKKNIINRFKQIDKKLHKSWKKWW